MLPSPGQCRIWHPGELIGRQPIPGNCAAVSRDVGPGDWLIHRPATDESIVEVSVYDRKAQGMKIAVWIYDFASGRHLGGR
jgi:hypothetical protein